MNSDNSVPDYLSRGLLRVRQSLANTGQPWALFGGGAVAVFHPARAIHDIDIITLDSALPSVATRLGVGITCDDFQQPMIRYANSDIYGRLNIRTAAGLCVFEIDEAMRGRIQICWSSVFLLSLPVLSREDNIVLKAILQRDAQHGKQDLSDIRILNQAGPLDVDYLAWRIERCAACGWADRLLRQMEILS